MNLTKKLEAEVRKAYFAIWDAYLSGDMRTFAALLDDDCYIIGSAGGEVFHNKRSALKYYKATADQISGKAEFRNRKINVLAVDYGIMVNEHSDFYLLMDDQWTYYGHARISSLFHKKNNKWKVVHQHGSFPDSKTEEGEQVNTDKIKAENIRLRDAVKRRTEELENKNRELEIETALERVRTVAMSMKKPGDLLSVCKTGFKELKKLGFTDLRNMIIHTYVDDQKYFNDYDYSDALGGAISRVPYKGNPIIENFIRTIRKGTSAFSEIKITGKQLDDWKEFRKANKEANDPRLNKSKALYYYTYSVGSGTIGISTFNPVDDEKRNILVRFRNVFDLSYRRYLDIEKAEAQAREAQIQLALERVRAKSLAMHHSSELQEVVNIAAEQLHRIGMDINGGVFICINAEVDKELPVWASGGAADYVQKAIVPFLNKPIFTRISAAIKKGNNFLTESFSDKEKRELFRYLFKHEPWRSLPKERKQELLSRKGGFARSVVISKHTSISITNHFGKLFTDEENEILKRFGKVFEQSYIRFLDLQKAETQAREAQIEVAVERVRAKALAMHRSDEIHEVVRTLRNELFGLKLEGITGATICLKQSDGQVRLWDITDVDTTGRYSWDILFDMSKIDPRLWVKRIWNVRKKIIAVEQDSNDLKRALQWLGHYNKKTAADITKLLKRHKINHGWHRAVQLANGLLITDFVNEPPAEIEPILLKTGAAFDLAYKRFLDLQKAEAQTREAQIEVAVERVRAKALAMQKSEDLHSVVVTLKKELRGLQIPDVTAATIYLQQDDGLIRILDLSGADNDDEGQVEFKLDKVFRIEDIHPKLWINRMWKRKENYFVEEADKADFDRIIDWLYTIDKSEASIAEKIIREKKIIRAWLPTVKLEKGIMNIDLLQPPAPEIETILLKIGAGFDLAYKRFLDLQNAEAQTREAQIEAALEKVRSRSLAMHKSDELKEVVAVLYQKLQELDFDMDQGAAIMITYSSDSKDITQWITDATQTYAVPFFIPFTDYAIPLDQDNARKKNLPFFSRIYNRKEKNEYFRYLFKHTQYSQLPEPVQQMILDSKNFGISIALEKNSAIAIPSTIGKLVTGDEITILKRFSNVFEQCYTRFLDLQKAEAQGREAQIQLALERVRARTMAMHRSDELTDVVKLLYQEFDKLKLSNVSTDIEIGLINEETGMAAVWAHLYLSDGTISTFDFPIGHFEGTIHEFKKWKATPVEKRNELFFTSEFKGKFWNKFKKWIKKFPELDEAFQPLIEGNIAQWVTHNAYFSHGILTLQGTETYSPETLDIQKRFTKVFEQTYTRFLDLKKAEAQAREAEIELALERIRARTMAMHASEELLDIIVVVSEQLQHLGIKFSNVSFGVNNPDYDLKLWMAVKGSLKAYPIQWTFIDNPGNTKLKEAQRNPDKVFTDVLTQAENNEWLQHIFICNPQFDIFSKEKRQRLLKTPGYARSLVIMKDIFLVIGNYAAIPYTDEENAIFKRFGNVFEQSYTRFLDLQKAEAQAREAQIEAALERVRSGSLAMHNSNELEQVVATLFNQLVDLGFCFDGALIFVFERQKRNIYLWIATIQLPAPVKIELPFDEEIAANAIINDLWKAIEKGEYIFNKSYSGNTKNEYFRYVQKYNGPKIPEPVRLLQLENESWTAYLVAEKNSIIGFDSWSGPITSLTDEDFQVVKRFAKVFEQAYIRFLDLQKAEQQAREAQIELGLERVRARAMAMQRSDELKELIGTVSVELGKLDIILDRSFIITYDLKTMGSTWWMANPETPSEPIGLFVKYHEHPSYLAHIKAWKERLIKWQYILEGSTKKEWDKFLFVETELSGLPEFVINNMVSKEKVYLSSSFNNFGYLTLATLEPLTDEQFDIMLRFAKVFDLTYTRFNDLKQAEAQARESQIQLALERVRAKTMAMHKSDELAEVAAVLFQQLNVLGNGPERINIGVVKEDKGIIEYWSTEQGGNQINHSFNATIEEPTTIAKVYAGWKENKKSMVVDLKGKDLKTWMHYLLKELNMPFKEELLHERRVHTVAFFSHGMLLISTPEPVHQETIHLLERFADVFNLTYRRFLDLQTAEAQAREAQIEAALEKVRARAMAMQKSSELSDTAYLLFQQFKELGAKANQFSIGIIKEKEEIAEMYATIEGDQLLQQRTISIHEPIAFKKVYTAWKQGKKNLFLEITGKDLEAYNLYRNKIIGRKVFPEEIKDGDRWIILCAYFSRGLLSFASFESPTEEIVQLLERFAKVFDQTYTRFLDLQKAEAQAREAQIELALERVRARTMAMHRSEELADVATVLFQQVKTLGVSQWVCGFSIWEVGDKEFAWYPGDPDGKILTPCKVPLTEHPVFISFDESRRRGDELFVYEKEGDFQADHYRYMMSVPGMRELLQQMLDAGLTFPTFQIDHLANFSHGNLVFITYEHVPEMHEIFKRFAKVFDLTYTRFLDLQKAEAQAREGKIQLGLERVRARTMAMQKAQELDAVIKTVYAELKQLDVSFDRCFIMIFDEKKGATWWMGSPEDDLFHEGFYVQYHAHPPHLAYLKGWEERQQNWEYWLGGQIKKDWDEFIFNKTGLSRLPSVAIEYMKSFEFANLSAAFENFGCITTGGQERISEESYNILSRFAKVFDLTYTRFLDLQKAEAQAREAQVQLALERVRARAMAMQDPAEFVEVVNVMGKQFIYLGFDIEWANFGANGLDVTSGIDTWNFAIIPGSDPVSSRLFIPWFDHPLFNDAKKQLDNYLDNGNDLFVMSYDKETKDRWLDHMFAQTIFKDVPDEYRAIQYEKPGYTTSNLALKDTWLSIGKFSTHSFTDEQHGILRRMGNAFGQAYTRFLDLQRAEAQARESQIQLALERVRARTMAMQRSDELPQAANLLFQQIQSLGMPTWSTGYCIWDDDKKAITLWMSSEGVIQPSLRMPLTEDPSLIHFLEAYQRGESFFVEEVGGEALRTHYAYLRTLPGVKETLDDIEKAGFPVPTFQIFHLAYFSKGFLLFITYQPVPEAHDIFKRFGKVFDQTYTRFLDLQRAEAQAREARIEISLERIRARALAMHSSDELMEVAKVLREQMALLGQRELESSVVHLYKLDPDHIHSWRAVSIAAESRSGFTYGHMAIPVNCCEVVREWLEKFNSDEQEYTLAISGAKQQEWYLILEKLAPEVVNSMRKENSLHEKRYYRFSKFSGGALLMISKQPPSEEAAYLQKRASVVFDLAYRRFSDLQKAEAQAREAQIEAALERVRSRTMAMHASHDLLQVTNVLSEQFVLLGFGKDETVGFITDGTEQGYNIWLAAPGDSFLKKFYVPRLQDKSTQLWNEAKEKGESFYTFTLTKQEKDIFFRNFFENTELRTYPDEAKQITYDAPGMATTVVLLDKITLTKSNFTGIPYTDEQNAIIKRFAFVFQQSYTRFLDLQKAEAQAREAQIEAALEKIRSRSLAMHKSEELQEVVNTVFERLSDLNIEIDSCNIAIFKERTNDWEYWIASPSQKRSAVFYMPYIDFGVTKDLVEAKEKGADFFTRSYSYEEKNEWFEYGFKNTDFKYLSEQRQKYILDAPAMTVGIAFAKYTGVQFNRYSFKSLSDDEMDILKRFAKVFEQAYIRFLDLQKAEAQAREAQIEAALERVRAKAMAMHKSNDLHEAVKIMFEEFQKLNLDVLRCGVGILDKNSRTGEIWATSISDSGIAVQISASESFDTHPLMSLIYESWQKQQDLDYVLKGQDLIDYYRAMKLSELKLPESQFALSEDDLQPQYYYGAMFKAGGLYSFRNKPFTDEDIKIMKRFASVVNLTYNRFIDLQKAEASAREAQIEAGLERVRSRTMAMFKSDELAETAVVMFRQLIGLGIAPNRLYIAIINDTSGNLEFWITDENGEKMSSRYVVNINKNISIKKMYEGWAAKKKTITIDMQGEELEAWLIYWNQEFHVPFKPGAALKRRVQNIAYFSKGFIAIASPDDQPESTINLLERFAAVFNLTYTRFNDLQQAEAQAREAQIEAGLERVRARTMAMHTSNDISAATATMFSELEKLGIEILRGGITIVKPDQTQEVWSITNMAEGKTIRAIGVFDMRMHGLWRQVFEAWQKKQDYTYYLLAGKDKEDYIALMNATPNYLSQTIKEIPDVHVQSYFFGEGAVWTNSLQPHSDEDKQILKRFASVFSLTFRRYQDLKKAEAQAKEATIEAALERVRGKAMAMHSSKDLATTIGVFYHELEGLNLTPRRCGVGLINKETWTAEISTMNATVDGQSVELVGVLDLKSHPILTGVYNNWLTKTEYHPVLRGNEIKEYYQLLRPQVAFPDYPADTAQYGYFFFFDEGGVYAWTEKELQEDELKIYRRFTSVLSLTYKRYKDLKDAELRAQNAVKEAALDRIRADIASMRTVEDLDRITPLIWNELKTLNVPFIRCGVFIMDDSQQFIHTFLSTPDGKAIAAFHLPYNTPGNIALVISNWRDKKKYIDHWKETEFRQFAEILVQQGALSSAENYLKTIPHGGFFLHFLPFLQGMLYVGNTEKLNSEEIELIQHVADAFSTAYARYEDFNRLEAAKQQVDKTLVDLKQAQQQLVQSEKMASLGELTAGIAHEIQNPLNFVNNFSDVSNELLEEMKGELATGNTRSAMEIVEDVKQNLEKILHHGKRADAIVKGMLQHSRTSSGQKEMTDINMLADEYLRLAYHGLRAKDKSFNAKFETHFDNNIGKINVIPQDIGRVILNLINNAFYAVSEKKKYSGTARPDDSRQNDSVGQAVGRGYEPTVTVTTQKDNGKIEIKVKDNGNGIPQKNLDKIFQPFFTTKPTGQGTGLGLSLAYDIITKGHGGELKVETKEGEGTEFVISL